MNGPVSKLALCAIYTRKSTEYNLELAFNSLDAQREACEAYIKSQAHEGWRLVISENCCERPGSSSVSQADSLARRCISLSVHLSREKSLVPKCSEITRNSPHIQK